VRVASGAAVFILLLRRRVAFLHRAATCRQLFKPLVRLVKLQDNGAVFRNFIALLKFSFESPLYFIHLTDMSILNAFIMHKSSCDKLTHKSFPEPLVQGLIVLSHEENVTVSGISTDRPSPFSSQLSRLEVKHSQNWPSKGKQRGFCVCSLKNRNEGRCVSATNVTPVCA
jgi:hypothetical protein